MYLRFFYLFLFLRKRGVLKCKGILREYSASGTAVLGSNSAEMTTVGGRAASNSLGALSGNSNGESQSATRS